ncbi:coagulation factor V [Zootoca vivipara]|uniref:coagulation factor V n=1 Tax=Zootoca vivipara TaxID=8524 RepID=UPI00293BFA1E|nr:coagulation factor V [Zootoca vivipara]
MNASIPCNTSRSESIFLGKLHSAALKVRPVPHVSLKKSASMGTRAMALVYKHLLLMLLGVGWPGLGNPSAEAARVREHYIVAQVANWSYSSQAEDLSRLPKSDHLFKKIIYSEYEADFKKEKPRNALSGLLGPTLRAEVGDTLVIHFKNLANKPLSIHPQGIAYSKHSEGSSYSDNTLPIEKLDDAVPPGKSYKYVWKASAGTGPREADPHCLTYAYYSHENMVQDFNSGLIGALLICKNGSLHENGTQKFFDREYVLMFAVFDESKSWQKGPSLMYTINGYTNGTLPDVQACAYHHISWHLIGMSSAPEIFSVHFNGQTLEQNHYKMSTINLVAGASATANMSVSKTGKWLISSLVEKHLQAGMHGYLKIEDCGNPDTLTRKLSYKELRMIKNWDYYIAAEEVIWDYAPEIPDSVDRKYKTQYLEAFSNHIGKKYKKAIFRQYKDASFTKRTDNIWAKQRGILGPVIRAEVRDNIKIVFKNMASRPYSIYVHGVTLSKDAEGVVYPSDAKENSTEGKLVQPGEIYTYHWTVLDTDEPTKEDPQCLTRFYHSAVDITRDIASGLIGPLLVCKRKALDMKGTQNKADVEQQSLFAVFDENKSWYLEDNIKRFCSNPSTVKRDDPRFYKSNVMHTLNGYASDRTDILGFCQANIIEWHLTSVGTQDEIVPVHLSGHTFLNRGKHQDILHLFPMSGESATVTMDNVGTWLLSSWGSHEMSNGMRLRFRDAKCDDVDYTENYDDASDYALVTFSSEQTETAIRKGGKVDKSVINENVLDNYDDQTEDDLEQEMFASMLGLRSHRNGSIAEEEEKLNITALAIQEEIDSTRNKTDGNATVKSHLVFTNNSDTSHGDNVLKSPSSASNTAALDSLHPNYTSLANDTLIAYIAAVVRNWSSEQGKSNRTSHGDNVLKSPSTVPNTAALDSLHPNYTSLANDTLIADIAAVVRNWSSEQGKSNRTSHGDNVLKSPSTAPNTAALDSLHPNDTSLANDTLIADIAAVVRNWSSEQGKSNRTSHGDNVLKSPSTVPNTAALDSLHPNYTSLANDTLIADIAAVVRNWSSEQGKSNRTSHGDNVLKSPSTAPNTAALDSLHPNDTSLANDTLIADIAAVVRNWSSEQGKSNRTSHGDNVLKSPSTAPNTAALDSLHPNYTSLANDALIADMTAVVRNLSSEQGKSNPTSHGPSTEKEQEDNKGEKDTHHEKSERQGLTEAILFALKEMHALLFHVQQKRNISALDNTTSDTPFLPVPSAETASSLDSSHLSHYLYDYEDEEEANTEFSVLSTNLPLAVAETVENNGSEQELLEDQQYDDLTSDGMLDSFASTPIPANLKDSPHQSLKCPPKKMASEWNVVSEKVSYDTEADLTKPVDNKLQNSSRNVTLYPENPKFPSKRKHEAYKAGSQLELGQLEMNNKQEALNEKRKENCTVSKPGTFQKARRKKKKPRVLAPRTSKPLMSPRGFGSTQVSTERNHTVMPNEVYDTLAPKEDKPEVTLGFIGDDGEYMEYDIDSTVYDDSSSGSFEYETVHYDNPYMTDPRLDSYTARNPDDIAKRYLRTMNSANIRRYYIAAEEVLWDYAGPRKSTVKSGQARTGYKKVIFRSYQDETFRTPEAGGEYEEHLGILGPVIRAEVEDVIQIHFKNLASRPYSLHAHGLYYEKSSEGRSYDDQSPKWFKEDDAILPNGTYTYVWHATQRSGPPENQRTCRSWAYYSAVNPEKDIHSGLIGPVLVCQKGMLDKYSKPKDMREFVLLFMVFDEEKSWYFNKYKKKTHVERISGAKRHHKFPAINGVSYHLQGLRMFKDEKVHWHLLNMGGPKDIHVVNFHGQTFTEQGMEDHQLGVYPLLPGSFGTVEMKPSGAGTWLLKTEVGEYQEAGMQASFTVIDTGCKLPMGLASGIIKDSQISASNYIGYWEPKLARLNNDGKYNAWSVGKNESEHPWIQVDLENQVLITGIQTQGAKRLMRSLYTMEYVIAYSKDGRKWVAFKGNHLGAQKVFEGNSDAHGIKENLIDPPVVARYIRVYPTKFYNRPTLRMELLGCDTEDCFMPLGMESVAIKNVQITASSYKKTWLGSWEPSLARLNLKGKMNAWQAKSNNNQQWLQIDLLQPKKITGIITQGAKSMYSEMYVKTFSILYSDDGSVWKPYMNDSTSMGKVFTGNINSGGLVKNYFRPPIFSRFLRVVPKTWNQSIVLRIELFGCDVF